MAKGPKNRASQGSRRPSYGSGGGQGGGRGPRSGGSGGGGYTGGTSHQGDSGCRMNAFPAIMLTLFYAMPRMLLDGLRGWDCSGRRK